MGGLSSSSQTTGPSTQMTSSTTTPWSVQTPYLEDAFSQAQNIDQSQNAGQMQYNGNFYATPTQGMNNVFSNALNSSAGVGQNAVNSLLGSTPGITQQGFNNSASAQQGLGNFANTNFTGQNIGEANAYANNPYLANMTNAATFNANQQFNQQTLPQMNRNAVASGNLNNTREGVAQGIAQEGLEQNAQNVYGNLAGQAYNSGLNMANSQNQNQLSALNNMGSLGNGMLNSGIYGTAQGTTAQGQNIQGSALANNQLLANQQAPLNNAIAQSQYQNQYPWQTLDNYYNIIGNRSWGGTTNGTTLNSGSTTTSTPSALSTIGNIGSAVGGFLGL